MKKVLVIGSSNVDYIIRTKKFPDRGETTFSESFEYAIGGKGLNQAVAASLTGAETTFLTALGNDNNLDYVLNELSKYNLNVKPIIKNTSTGTAIIIVEDESGENEIIVNSGANKKLDKTDIDNNIELIKNHDYILLQLELDIKVIEYIIKIAKELDKIVILNPAPFSILNKDVMEMCDFVTPNEGEYQKLLESNIKLNNVIVTMGSNGSKLISGDKEIKIPAHKVLAVDTTGAGDCYNGTFVGFLAQGYEISDALNFASYASALSVKKVGAAKSYPTKDEILKLKASN